MVNCATLFYLYSCDIREPEKLPLGRRGNMLNHKVRGFLRGWVGWSNFKKLVQDMNWFFLYSFLWGSFMWQKQDQKVELFLGKLWENLTTIFAKWKHQSKCKIYLIWYCTSRGPSSDAGGLRQGMQAGGVQAGEMQRNNRFSQTNDQCLNLDVLRLIYKKPFSLSESYCNAIFQ